MRRSSELPVGVRFASLRAWRTVSMSADRLNAYPRRSSRSTRWDVTCRPATFSRFVRCGKAKPSTTGTTWVTPSPESITRPAAGRWWWLRWYEGW